MDPNENAREQWEILTRIRYERITDRAKSAALTERAHELWHALRGWLRNGGFAPAFPPPTFDDWLGVGMVDDEFRDAWAL
jgi:hypothetical protein